MSQKGLNFFYSSVESDGGVGLIHYEFHREYRCPIDEADEADDERFRFQSNKIAKLAM